MDTANLSLPHLIRPPKVRLRHAPLLILLHGQDSSEKDIFGISNSIDGRFLVVCPRGSFNRLANRNNWYMAELVSGSWATNSIQAEYSRQNLAKFLGETITAYQTNPSQTFLMGFCQGAVMALDLLRSDAKRLAGVV